LTFYIILYNFFCACVSSAHIFADIKVIIILEEYPIFG